MPQKNRTTLTRLEGEVMRAVWDAEPESVRVRDVVEVVNARRARQLAYTTVQTVLTILREKGIVRIVDARGRAHVYRAKLSRADASRNMMGEIVDRLFDGRVQPLLQQLIDDGDLDSAELQELRGWVEDRLRDAGEDEP